MAIFGDVNDNRVIPLILLSGLIFLVGVYAVCLFKWLRGVISKSRIMMTRFGSGDEFEGSGAEEAFASHDMARKQSTISAWDMEASIIHFPTTIKELPEE